MRSSGLARWGGSAALLGGLLLVVYAVGTAMIPDSVGESAGHALYHVFNAPPNALLAVGIAGLYVYLRRGGRFGIVGKVGFWMCAVVFALTAVGGVGIIVSEMTLGGAGVAVLDIIHPMLLLLMLGAILFGIGALRAGDLPRGGAIIVLAAPIALLATFFAGVEAEWAFSAGMAVFGLGWAWLGYGLRSRQMDESTLVRPAI
ncbi:MAG: hypothetical protein ACRDSJ_13350 [Rubrobacteraceae bacterium]